MVGNENADRLACRGTRGVRKTRYSAGLPECYLEEKWLDKMAFKRWQDEKDIRQAKLLIGEQLSKTGLAEVRKLETVAKDSL